MQLKKIIITKNTLLIAYKLLYDLLSLLLITFISMLVAEGLLPGLISSKISFSKITILLIIIFTLITYLGKNLGITYEKLKINNNKLLPFIIISSFLLIGNSLLKFTFWENSIITITTLFIFFLFYEIIFSSKE